MTEPTFPPPSSDKSVLENGTVFTPRFDANGLVTAVVTDITDGKVLMVAHMNAEALALTLETGIAHYWSRSRQMLWKKGETSGNLQHVKQLRTDCDQDALVVEVAVAGDGVSCHTGKHSCFYRIITGADGTFVLTAE